VNDIDEALTRPGRWHAVKNLRSLTPDEGERLVTRICGHDAERAERAKAGLVALGLRSWSVAQVYNACR
jgi:hypothetical protein